MTTDQVVVHLIEMVLSLGFLGIIWKIAWAMRGWLDAEKMRAQTEREIVEVIREFGATQKDISERILQSMEKQAQRMDRLMQDQFEMHRAVRAVNRKLRYFEGDNGFEAEANTA